MVASSRTRPVSVIGCGLQGEAQIEELHLLKSSRIAGDADLPSDQALSGQPATR